MITENIILWNTKYGSINCNLKQIMLTKKISIYQLSRISDIKYEVIKRYYDDNVLRYDGNILAKLCYSLDCKIEEILQYNK